MIRVTTMTEAALELARRGLSVLPVTPDKKKPMFRSWEKYQTERPTEENLRLWFDSLNPVGIGAVTGAISGIVVVDIDTRAGMGYEEVTDKWPTELIARTPSGGFHLYYRHPGYEVKNRVNSPRHGVDIRADGGFVVLPPTTLSDGSGYQWILQGAPGKYPEGFIGTDTPRDTPDSERWVRDMLRGVEAGERNESAARLSGYLINKAMPIDIVMSIMQEWNEKNSPPMELRELETTVQSVYRKHQRDGKSSSTPRTIELQREREGGQGPAFDLVPMTEYFREYGGGGVEWAVEGWLPDRSITFLVSPPESYKTWILLDLAVAMTSGADFLDQYKVVKPGPVIIIQQEDSHMGVTERLSVIIQGKLGLHPNPGSGQEDGEVEMPVLPELPIYLHPSRNLHFDDTKVMDELEEAIRKIRPRVVIIDPLYSAAKMDNYMADATEDMFRLKKFRDEYGCSFVIAHHSKKNVDPDSTAREDGWGSQFLNAFLEAGWQVRRNARLPDNEIVVRRHSKTTGNMGLISLQFDISTKYPMQYEVKSRPYNPATDTQGARGQIYELLAEGGPLNMTELADKTGKHKSTVSRQLKQLETANQVSKMPDGRYKVVDEDLI